MANSNGDVNNSHNLSVTNGNHGYPAAPYMNTSSGAPFIPVTPDISDQQPTPSNISQLNPSPFSVINIFDIPGFKIIIIPVSHSMLLSVTSEVFGFDIPGFKIIAIPVNQPQQRYQ